MVPVIEAIISNNWAEGLHQLFAYERTSEIFTSMYCTERKALYEKLNEIAENLLTKNKQSKKLLSSMMKGLVLKPYSTLTFLLMFKYIHKTGTKIRTSDVDPSSCSDDLFVIMYKKNNLHEMAEGFDEACNSELSEKARYKNILTKLIDFSFILMPCALPISRIWKSIKVSS